MVTLVIPSFLTEFFAPALTVSTGNLTIISYYLASVFSLDIAGFYNGYTSSQRLEVGTTIKLRLYITITAD